MTKDDIEQAEVELAALDPVLGALIKTQELQVRQERADFFASLCRAVIGQQVSVAAASAIYQRFEQVTDLKPDVVLALNEARVKTIGLSQQKVTYLQDIARHFYNNPKVYNHLNQQSDDQVIAELTAIKGIGVWTAQMFLMFTLKRPDVFAPDDVGLQRAMAGLYGWGSAPAKSGLVKVAQVWSPYRTVASLHLWQSLDSTSG